MKCKKCGNDHDGSFGSGIFCSISCANSRIRTEEIKRKISEGVSNSEVWKKVDYSKMNSDPNKILKNKETWKNKRNWSTAHISTIKKWIREDRLNICEECGIDNWLGKKITLEIDHIDGNTKNNSPENLKLLCPNCHSQTPTWRRNKPKLK